MSTPYSPKCQRCGQRGNWMLAVARIHRAIKVCNYPLKAWF